MARVTVDFSEVQDFEALEKGEYPVVITDAKYRVSQSEDKYDYINLEMTITEGEFKDRKLWMILSFSPKALWRMKDVFENLGLYEEEIEVDYDEDTEVVTQPELIGLPGLAVVSQRTYEGRVQNQVDALISADDAPVKTNAKKEPATRKKTASTGSAKKKTSSTSSRRFK